MSNVNKQQYLMRAAYISLGFNVVLFIFKFAAVLIVRSLAIATDFAITVVGLVVSVILYKSLKLSSRPADLLHNYGYGKVEHVCEALEGIIIIGIAFIMSMQALMSLFHPGHIAFPWIGFASSVLSLSLNFIGAFFLFKIANKSYSPAVRAEAVHYTLEGFISTAIAGAFMLTIFLNRGGFTNIEGYIDPCVTIVVSIAICIPSIGLARKASINLLDASIEEPSKMEVIARLAGHTGSFCEFKDLKSRSVGHKKLIEMKIVLPRDMSFQRSFQIASDIEKDIASAVHNSEVSISIMPCAKDCALLKNNRPCPYI